MPDPLRDADIAVQLLRKTLRSGASGLKGLPDSLRLVLKTGAWRRRIELQSQEEVGFDSFEEFVRANPLNGLGSDVATIKRLCGDDRKLLDMIDRVTGHNQGKRTDLVYIVNKVEERPDGNSKAAALRRLRNDRPDLHSRVLAGDLSPHAAAIEAGFRKRTLTVPLEPQAAAAALRRRFTPDQLAELIAALEDREVLV